MPDPFSDGVSVCGPEDTSWKVGGGSSYTTAADLHRIVRALYAGRLMKASPFDVLPHRTMFGKRSFESSGAFPGANANLTYFPDDQLTVIVLSNNYAPVTSPIAKDVAAMAFGLPYEVPRVCSPASPPPPDPRVLGEWVIEGYPPATIVERNGRYVLVWTRARQEALIPLGPGEYFLPLDFARMTFTFGEPATATFPRRGRTSRWRSRECRSSTRGREGDSPATRPDMAEDRRTTVRGSADDAPADGVEHDSAPPSAGRASP